MNKEKKEVYTGKVKIGKVTLVYDYPKENLLPAEKRTAANGKKNRKIIADRSERAKRAFAYGFTNERTCSGCPIAVRENGEWHRCNFFKGTFQDVKDADAAEELVDCVILKDLAAEIVDEFESSDE